MNKSLKRVIVSAMALSLLVPAVSAPKAEAAAKPKLSAKSVKVTVGAKKKVTVKKVKAKKIKKTTWSLPKKGKKIVSLSAKKKTGVTLKGKKAGKTTLTAKVRVGKKTYKLKTKITVVKKNCSYYCKANTGRNEDSGNNSTGKHCNSGTYGNTSGYIPTVGNTKYDRSTKEECRLICNYETGSYD